MLNNKKEYILQFLPKSLEEISHKKKIEYNLILLKSSYIIDIIHNLLLRYYFKKENLFNLSSKILKERYGAYYNYYIKYLCDLNYLILDKNYLKGKNTRIYRLNPEIIKSEIKRYKNCDKFLLKKYQSMYKINIEKKESKIDPDIRIKLITDLFSVKVDYTKSIFYLDSINQELDVYNRNKYSVDCIEEKYIFYNFDDYGRLHTNFTTLKSHIRKNFLLIDDEEVIEFDIKNSQPLFLYKLIEENDIFIVDEKELLIFKELTTKGLFYQYLMEKSGISNKKEIKELVYKVLFGKNYKNKADTIFESIFPTIYKFIKSYKKENSNYKILSYQLQNLESNLIFNKIVRKIMDNHPDIKILTIHDSIICANKNKNIVGPIFFSLIKEEFNI